MEQILFKYFAKTQLNMVVLFMYNEYRLKGFQKKSWRSEMILFLHLKRRLKPYQMGKPQEPNILEDGAPPPHLTISSLIRHQVFTFSIFFLN